MRDLIAYSALLVALGGACAFGIMIGSGYLRTRPVEPVDQLDAPTIRQHRVPTYRAGHLTHRVGGRR